ncbi:Lrp/AsnC family transcriptional regulator [Abyssisolibacter fermentans]|uniref:Lrp/AsnC family transcriptional regulator n=1 Tax=Abyssisolibacter fermentans TaxID=1766203 RepID=UPI00082B3198|nr:Lrp/AsnC family transcriptional regulator [Abyssisolibacter fermentans]
MDITDSKIIEILQNDGRISMKDLGKLVSLSPPAVAERVKKLEDVGIIEGYRAIINPVKLNKNITAFISLNMKEGRYEQFLEYAKNKKSIIECHHVTGGDCLNLKVLVKDIQELEQLIDEIKLSGNTQTSIILSSPINNKIII